jgi:hypothetical protein
VFIAHRKTEPKGTLRAEDKCLPLTQVAYVAEGISSAAKYKDYQETDKNQNWFSLLMPVN